MVKKHMISFSCTYDLCNLEIEILLSSTSKGFHIWNFLLVDASSKSKRSIYIYEYYQTKHIKSYIQWSLSNQLIASFTYTIDENNVSKNLNLNVSANYLFGGFLYCSLPKLEAFPTGSLGLHTPAVKLKAPGPDWAMGDT